MGILSQIGSALLNCISKPVDALCEWAKEPLKDREYRREEASKESEHKRNMDVLTAKKRVEHELRMSELNAEYELREKEKTLEVDLEVRRVREIEKAVAEIQEWRKSQELERMERTTAAIARYKEQLTKLNIEVINSIGNMQLDLKERAQKFVYEKAVQYKRLQDEATEEAMNDLIRIEEKFGDNERAKDILIRAVDTKMGNVIDTSTRFLEELNRDIVSLNQSIDRLTNQGQKFIESHLERFHIVDATSSLYITGDEKERLLLKNIN